MQASAGSPGSACGESPPCQSFPVGAEEVASCAWDEAELVGTVPGGALPESVAGAAAAETAEDMGDGMCGWECVEDTSSDMSEPWLEDGDSAAADVITSACADWCAHEAAGEAEADPLASFFAQLVSSHSLAELAGESTEGPSDPPDMQARPSEHTHNASLTLEDDCPEGESSDSAELTAEGDNAEEPHTKPRHEACRADSGLRRVQTLCMGKTVADTIDPELRAYFAASLKRNNFPHILGSLRAAILRSPEVFGFYGDGSIEAEASAGRPFGALHTACSGACLSDRQGRGAGVDLQEQQQQQQYRLTGVNDAMHVAEEMEKRTDGYLFLGERDGAEGLLPPAVSVSGDFCRVNPRVAVRWLAQTQMESMLEGGHPQQQLKEQQQQRKIGERLCERLVGTSWAQLACLVPPKALCSKPAAIANPAREEMQLAAAQLAKGLNNEQMHALKRLLQAWYFSGFFAGQLHTTASGS